MTIEPIIKRPAPAGSGVQKIYRFDNDFGASVVRFEIAPGVGSYGADRGLWELAVLEFSDEDYELTYDTPVTDDVLGHLSDIEVEDVLARIRDLPKKGQTQ